MPDVHWTCAFASSIGNGHIAESIPCQDACIVQARDGYIISVVSDGAGSGINSHYGSRQVVDSCIYFFDKAITTHGWANENLPAEALWHDVAKECLFSVRQDLEKYSLGHEMEFKSLAATVIVVIAFKNCLLVTHIGDGRAGYCSADLNWQPMIAPFRGELANQTVFITSDIWDADITDNYVESRIITGDIKAFCLLTDGCEKAAFECNLYDESKEVYYDPNKPYALFFDPNVKILKQLHGDGKTQQEVNALWQKFLEGGNERLKTETDDKTMILAVSLS